MIIVNIIGGLGNQMFQYAFGYALSKRRDTLFKIDTTMFHNYDLRHFELEKFSINLSFASKQEIEEARYKKILFPEKLLRTILKKDKPFSKYYYKEKYFYYQEELIEQKNKYFEGYWQSEKYFKAYREELLKQFTLKNGLHRTSNGYLEKINATNAVSLHIRRGDYVNNPDTNSVHGTCSLEYYLKAIQIIDEKVNSPYYFIFSDDLNWVKKHFSRINSKIFIELSPDVPDHDEMILMSQCKCNIIANSSFSWWGAWLNQNPDKIIIAPKRWFNDAIIDTKDRIPEEWIQL